MRCWGWCGRSWRGGGGEAHATAEGLMAGRYEGARGVTVCCATDGNHGRSVAWGAQRFGVGCCIFVHATVSAGRVAAIAAYGAEVRRVAGTYDDAVGEAAVVARREGWHLVSDTSWPGYTEVPREVMQGYRVMVDEALDQMPAPPTHVFVQAGVGGWQRRWSVHMRSRVQPEPVLVVVEPEGAACLFGECGAGGGGGGGGGVGDDHGGLACGEPSLLAWQELDRAAAAFLSIPDAAAVEAMRLLAGWGWCRGSRGRRGWRG